MQEDIFNQYDLKFWLKICLMNALKRKWKDVFRSAAFRCGECKRNFTKFCQPYWLVTMRATKKRIKTSRMPHSPHAFLEVLKAKQVLRNSKFDQNKPSNKWKSWGKGLEKYKSNELALKTGIDFFEERCMCCKVTLHPSMCWLWLAILAEKSFV